MNYAEIERIASKLREMVTDADNEGFGDADPIYVLEDNSTLCIGDVRAALNAVDHFTQELWRAETFIPLVERVAALEIFTDYFVRNYPGPNTIIGDPHWHAPRIFRAATHAILQALAIAETACPAQSEGRQSGGTKIPHRPESTDSNSQKACE